jgi:hypothetical protein
VSDLALARAPRPDHVLRETLCFGPTSSGKGAEGGVDQRTYPCTENTQHQGTLVLDMLPQGLLLTEELREAATLTVYAVTTRYPTEMEAVTQEDHEEAVRSAEAIVAWAERMIEGTG